MLIFSPKNLLVLLLATTQVMMASPLPTQPMKIEALPAPSFSLNGGLLLPLGDRAYVTSRNGEKNTLWSAPADPGNPWEDTGIEVPVDAAAAHRGSAWILVGGLREGAPIASVSILELVNGRPSLRPLPDLPVAVAGAGAAVIADKLYVFGGATCVAPFIPTADLWILNLTAPTSWTAGPKFPGEPRAYAAATAQYGMLCLFGGTGRTLLAETWIFRPSPLEGTKDSGWKQMTDLPNPITRGAALPMGQAQVLVIAGEGEAAPEQGGGRPLLFHTLTDAWFAFDAVPGLTLPMAGRVSGKILVMGNTPDGAASAMHLEAERIVRNLGWLDYSLIVGYFLLISGIGIYFSRKQETSAEFSLGNRQVKWWAAGISMFATGASAISFIAIPALAFATNLVWLFPIIAMIPGYFVTAYFIYPMLRRLEIASTYEYLERRFNLTLRTIASLQAILFQAFARSAVVLLLPSLAISSVTGIDVFSSVLIMGVITTIYTAIGGFEAVIWTEVLQAVLMLLAPVLIIWICITSLPGGLSDFWSTGVAYSKFDFAIFTTDVSLPAVWVLMLGSFLTATLATAGDQPMIQRIFSAPLKEVRRVNATFTICGIIIGILVNVMGIAIFAYFRAHPEMLDPHSQNDQIVPIFVTQAMPIGLPGLVIAAIFAAAMSTVASSMNSVATIFTEDFFVRMRPQSTDRQRLLSLKLTSYAVGVIGTVMALVLAAQDLKSMMVVWAQISALVGGGIVGVFSLGMFTRRANGFGAICGTVLSVLITIAIKLWTPLHWGTYLPIAIGSCIFFGYLFSLFAPQRKHLAGLTVFTPADSQT